LRTCLRDVCENINLPLVNWQLKGGRFSSSGLRQESQKIASAVALIGEAGTDSKKKILAIGERLRELSLISGALPLMPARHLRYSRMTKKKFLDLLLSIKGRNLTEKEMSEAHVFYVTLGRLAALRSMYEKFLDFPFMCQYIAPKVREIFTETNTPFRYLITKDFKTCMPSLFPLNDEIFMSWCGDNSDAVAHFFLVARIAGESFIIDLTADQFIKSRGKFKKLGIFIMPEEELDLHSWPYISAHMILAQRYEPVNNAPISPVALQRIQIITQARPKEIGQAA